jgi:hypothetical protein
MLNRKGRRVVPCFDTLPAAATQQPLVMEKPVAECFERSEKRIEAIETRYIAFGDYSATD